MTHSKPRDLPGIKQYFYHFLTQQAQRDPHNHAVTALQEQTANALMLWVSEEMTLLTSTAQDTLPDDSGNFFPEASGIALFDGGTGVQAELDYFPQKHWTSNAFGQLQPPTAEIDGVLWLSTDNREDVLFFGISLHPNVPNHQTPHDVLIIDVRGAIETRLSKFMRTVWLLSSQEGMTE